MFGSNVPTPVKQPDGSHVATDMRIVGNIFAEDNLDFAGELEGNIEADTVHLLVTAKVNGDIKANSVVVDGTVTGKIIAKKVRLSETAIFKGALASKGIVIDEGAEITASFTKEIEVNG